MKCNCMLYGRETLVYIERYRVVDCYSMLVYSLLSVVMKSLCMDVIRVYIRPDRAHLTEIGSYLDIKQ